MNDFRYALRTLRNSPGFTLVVTVLLAIGIGANCVIFSALDAVMLKRLPVRQPEQLFRVVTNLPQLGKRSYMPFALYQALRDRSQFAIDVFGEQEEPAGLTEPAPAEQIRVNLVTPNYFSALGVVARYGRVLAPGDVDAAVIGYAFFERRFSGDPRAVGRSMVVQGHRFTIVGVLPRQFNGVSIDTAPELRIPLTNFALFPNGLGETGQPANIGLSVRLRPGVNPTQASSEINSIWRAVEAQSVLDIYKHVELDPLEHGISRLRDKFSDALIFLIAAVGVLLLMVCVNVAGLMLARSASRRQEIAVRLALGATRGRLIRQMLAESVLLAVIGGMGGLAIAFGATPLLERAIPPMRDLSTEIIPVALHLRPDLRVLGFSLLLCIVTTMLFGLAPAWHSSRAALYDALRSVRATSGWRGRQALIVFEIALCTVLLAGAGLLIRTFQQLQGVDAGFDRDRVVTFTVNPELAGDTPEHAESIQNAWIERVRALPGVNSVAVASRPLMRGSGIKMTVGVAGQLTSPADFMNVSANTISPEYLDTMGIRLLQGRNFTPADASRNPRAVIVNQAFVRQFFPDGRAAGRMVGSARRNEITKAERQIIGVVSDAKYRSLREPAPPIEYGLKRPSNDRFVLHVRTASQPESIINPVRDALRAVDPQLPITEIHTLAEEVSTSLWSERLVASLATIFGALAAILTAVGLYGLLAYTVAQRTREIGIRMALGAREIDIVRDVGRPALAMVGAGVAIGIGASLAVAPAIRALLYGIAPSDPPTLVLTVVFLVFVALLAAAAPILRALRVDPAIALRQD